MSQAVVTAENLSKAYRLGLKKPSYPTLREAISHAVRAPFQRLRANAEATEGADVFWALKNVSFEVQQGEVMGLIGRNGAGKSTLLKVLSRITEPTGGRAVLKGRVASLLEVGTGFHPELSGRENIYLNGSILGMRRSEINAKFDQIVEFSEVEQFLDTPVKRYSSGMYVRLAFAVAAHLDPEILIVDEVLAVGDAQFQKKCLGKMQDIASGGGRTVLFVSHNMDTVLSLCTRVVVVDKGESTQPLDPQEGVRRYLTSTAVDTATPLRDRARAQVHIKGQPPLLTDLRIIGPDGPTHVVASGGGLRFELDVENPRNWQHLDCQIHLLSKSRNRLAVFNSRYHSGLELPESATVTVHCDIPSIPLVPDTYQIDLVLSDGHVIAERIEQAARIEVVFADRFGTGRLPAVGEGYLALDSTWKIA